MEPISDRRRFLVHSVSASLFAMPLASFLLNACKSVSPSRMTDSDLAGDSPLPSAYKPTELANAKSIRLSATDPQNQRNIGLYSKAVAGMKATEFPIEKNGRKITWWEAHALIHDEYCPHGNWFFLPWHRAYLHHFELVCRAFCADDSFSLPYWDWSSDAKLPPEFEDGEEASNPLCNDSRVVAKRTALQIEEVSQAKVDEILKTLDFQTFAGSPSNHPRPLDKADKRGYRGTLEAGPHNKVHATIQGDMGSFISPRDPIFWLHHCNVDRLWEVWRAQVMANGAEPLPPELRGADNAVNAELDKAFPGLTYWKNHLVGGYYAIAKVDEVFTAKPAQMQVADVLEASSLGLLYQAPAKVPMPRQETDPVAVAGPSASGGESLSLNAEPKLINPQTTNVPTRDSRTLPKFSKRRSRQRTVPLKAHVLNSLQQNKGVISGTSTGAGTVRIEASRDIEQALRSAAGKQWTAAALRLKIDHIPTPSDPSAELHIYLNTEVPSGKRENPGFVGAMSFFGHDHDPEGIGAIFDLLPTVKALAAAGNAPFGKGAPQALIFSAVWDKKTVATNLSGLSLNLDYLEHIL